MPRQFIVGKVYTINNCEKGDNCKFYLAGKNNPHHNRIPDYVNCIFIDIGKCKEHKAGHELSSFAKEFAETIIWQWEEKDIPHWMVLLDE